MKITVDSETLQVSVASEDMPTYPDTVCTLDIADKLIEAADKLKGEANQVWFSINNV